MLEETSDIVKGIGAVLGLVSVIGVYLDAKRKHPDYHYNEHSEANSDAWRWRKPNTDLALNVEDDEQKSSLYIPAPLLFFEKVLVVFGYAAALGTLAIYAMFISRGSGLPDYFIGTIFILLSWALLRVGSRVSSISLYPEKVVVVESYAFVLKHVVTYRREKKLHFIGKSQSVFELTIDHKEPDYKLIIEKKGFIFSNKKRWILKVNQSQGSWLVEGLECWRDYAGLVDLNK